MKFLVFLCVLFLGIIACAVFPPLILVIAACCILGAGGMGLNSIGRNNAFDAAGSRLTASVEKKPHVSVFGGISAIIIGIIGFHFIPEKPDTLFEIGLEFSTLVLAFMGAFALIWGLFFLIVNFVNLERKPSPKPATELAPEFYSKGGTLWSCQKCRAQSGKNLINCYKCGSLRQ